MARGSARHHLDSLYMEPGTGLPCAYPLHCFQRRAYHGRENPEIFQKLSYPHRYHWKEWKNRLYETDWCPYIKETFNGFGNAIEYLGRYTHRIAISNSRILSVSDDTVVFSAIGKKPGEPKRQNNLEHTEFIRRYLMHVLPPGFQKIRYYGFLNNRMKNKNLSVIFKLQNGQRFKRRFAGMTMAELLKAVWKFDICLCPVCGHPAMKQLGRCYAYPF